MLSNDLVINIAEYEEGRLNEKEVIIFFQQLVEKGTINYLQGSYQRRAQEMIEEGLINE